MPERCSACPDLDVLVLLKERLGAAELLAVVGGSGDVLGDWKTAGSCCCAAASGPPIVDWTRPGSR